MGSQRHAADSHPWGSAISPKNSSAYGLANYLDPPRLVYLSPNGAHRPLPGAESTETARELARAGKIDCIYPGCGAYKHVASGENRRAGFVHPDGKSGSDHITGPETFDHVQSKAALLWWVVNTCGKDAVDYNLDTRNITAESQGETRQVRPDAWVQLSTGREIAIEFQHSAADFRRVRAKTEAYESREMTVWWVFSGRSPEACLNPQAALRPNKQWSQSASLTPGQIELLQQGRPFFWFDHEHHLLATPVMPRHYSFSSKPGEQWDMPEPRTANMYLRAPIPSSQSRALIYENNLDECAINLDTGKLITPATRKIRHQQRQALEEIACLRQKARDRYAAEITLTEEQLSTEQPPEPPPEPSPPPPPAQVADSCEEPPQLPSQAEEFSLERPRHSSMSSTNQNPLPVGREAPEPATNKPKALPRLWGRLRKWLT